MATESISRVEGDFILAAMAEGKRVDGRNLLEMRRITLRYDRTPGRSLAEVQLGRTRVAVVTTADVVPPFPDRPMEGFLVFNPEFSPMASPSFESGGRPTPQSVELGLAIDRLFKDAHAIDTEALCIAIGEKVWSVRCDIHILDHGGNLFDAAVLATIASLRHFRRREVSIVGERVVIHSYEDRVPVPLSLHHSPVAASFAFFPGLTDALALDPSDREELVADGQLSLALNGFGELCLVHKLGGHPVDRETLSRAIAAATATSRELLALLEKSLEEAEKAAADRDRREHARAAGFVESSWAALTPAARDVEKAVSKTQTFDTKMKTATKTSSSSSSSSSASSSSSSSSSTSSSSTADTTARFLDASSVDVGTEASRRDAKAALRGIRVRKLRVPTRKDHESTKKPVTVAGVVAADDEGDDEDGDVDGDVDEDGVAEVGGEGEEAGASRRRGLFEGAGKGSAWDAADDGDGGDGDDGDGDGAGGDEDGAGVLDALTGVSAGMRSEFQALAASFAKESGGDAGRGGAGRRRR